MPDERQILLSSDPVPRPSVIILSALAHMVALVLVVVALRQAARIRILPPQYQAVQTISGTAHLSFNATSTRSAQLHTSRVHRRKRRARTVAGNAAEGAAVRILRERAKRATAGLMESLRFRTAYGFSSDHYELAVQTAGELPAISASELPPHFEQYVTVEVTIDVDGHVAYARVVGGMVDHAIERKLLAAVRGFKYSPAKHDGAPIPSQLDIVVHIPT